MKLNSYCQLNLRNTLQTTSPNKNARARHRKLESTRISKGTPIETLSVRKRVNNSYYIQQVRTSNGVRDFQSFAGVISNP